MPPWPRAPRKWNSGLVTGPARRPFPLHLHPRFDVGAKRKFGTSAHPPNLLRSPSPAGAGVSVCPGGLIMESPRDQITTLLENGLYDSAQMLGCFLVSSAVANAENSPCSKAETLVFQGDALYGEKEFRRALNMYKQALQLCKIIPKQTASATRSSFSATNRSSSPNSLSNSAINENEVKFKISLCHCALNENRAALAEMDGIPSKARTLRMNITLGKLFRISRHNRAAIGCYKDCLRHCPYVLEAITALAEMGISAKDIVSLFPQLAEMKSVKYNLVCVIPLLIDSKNIYSW